MLKQVDLTKVELSELLGLCCRLCCLLLRVRFFFLLAFVWSLLFLFISFSCLSQLFVHCFHLLVHLRCELKATKFHAAQQAFATSETSFVSLFSPLRAVARRRLALRRLGQPTWGGSSAGASLLASSLRRVSTPSKNRADVFRRDADHGCFPLR